jgi:integrase
MARLRPRGPYWELAWSGPDVDPATGKKNRHTRNLGRRDTVPKRDADLALRELQRSLFLDEHRLRAPVAPTLTGWAQDYLTWHALQWPAAHYRVRQVIEQHILPGWEFKRLDEVTDRDVEDRLNTWRAAGYRDHTLAKHLRILKALLNRAVAKGLLAASPADAVLPPQILDSAPHIFFEADELEALYLASAFDAWHPEAPQHADWHGATWKLLANTGMRRGEALNAKRSWARADVIRVVSTGEERTKSGKWREIPLGPGAREALEGLDEVLGDREYLLPRVAPPSLSRAASKCIERADLEGSIHTLRHTFSSHLAMDPMVAIRDIQLWAGHASIATTEKYMYLRRSAAVRLAL